ncbi:MAG: alpha/beta hydrolase [Austwickia sp.]|nr:alpha/beta hydrolase [Actinomycetota bacterium]MCB1253711.1 alpha/beta hydrolase [Austwickia sp.]MCO5309246.1 alpha/beta hydrolase [Austwickia sp.]
MEHRTVGTGSHHVIALHGWFGSAQGWGSFPQYVDGAAFTYHFMDYRGYGVRRAEPGDYTLAEISADVRRLADEAGLAHYSLLGHSMGGAAALRTLADDRDRVLAVVGVSPVGATPSPFDDAGRDLFWGAAQDPAKRAGIIDFTTGNRNTAVWVGQVAAHSLQNSTVAAFAGYLEAWANADFAQELRGIDVPVLVVPGRHDPALGEATVRQTWLPLFPHATLEVVDNAGHYPMDEAPVNLVTIVEGFLGGVAAGTSRT